MKYVIYTIGLCLIMSLLFFVNGNGAKEKENMLVEKRVIVESDTSKTLEKANDVLSRSENLEKDFEKTYNDKELLWRHNLDLKKENATLKDSVETIANELKVIQIRLKEAKKRNLIQRVFNMTPDTIETIVLDTIQ
jgi:hypothetical protein